MTSMPRDSKTNTSKIAQPQKRGGSSSLRLRNLKYYTSQSLKSMWRNKFMSLTSMLTVAACMVMVIASFAATSNMSLFLSHLENTVGIVVHIDDELGESQRVLLGQQLAAADNVANITLFTPDENLDIMAEMWGDVHGVFRMAVEDERNPLSYTYLLQLDNVRMKQETINTISAFFGVDYIDHSMEVADTLVLANNFIAILGIVIIGVLAILSVAIITNTIKLTVNSRRNEIIIMKYVGATDWFVRWPFVIEGVLIGVFGSLLPLGIIWFFYDGLIENVLQSTLFQALLNDFPVRASGEIFPIAAPFILIFGMVIGTLGSITSMRRHLDV
ncbi:MAG: permease-like cell division protein FtsX [Defluviitaleaceae bacterium]|nr:permease-like cell division protein FtsX [Defluviitaleaceae bacterium]